MPALAVGPFGHQMSQNYVPSAPVTSEYDSVDNESEGQDNGHDEDRSGEGFPEPPALREVEDDAKNWKEPGYFHPSRHLLPRSRLRAITPDHPEASGHSGQCGSWQVSFVPSSPCALRSHREPHPLLIARSRAVSLVANVRQNDELFGVIAALARNEQGPLSEDLPSDRGVLPATGQLRSHRMSIRSTLAAKGTRPVGCPYDLARVYYLFGALMISAVGLMVGLVALAPPLIITSIIGLV